MAGYLTDVVRPALAGLARRNENQEILNCYAGIYKILDGFPDSYNYLILSELSLSTPKPPLAKIIKIIKEVVGRLESEPSRIPN